MANRRDEAPRRVDQPEPGYFLVKFVRGGVQVPAAILFKRGLWCAVINGVAGNWNADWCKAKGVDRVWTGQRIDRAEYDRRTAMAGIPGHPASTPDRPVDLSKTPPLF